MYTVAIAIWYIGSLTKSVFKVNSKDISNIANSVKFFNNSDICNLLSWYKLTYRVISGKHGVNPSMAVCFFCNEAKEIVLFGKLKKDVEAPREVLIDYEPCDKCKEKFKEGVTVVAVTTEQQYKNQPSITTHNDEELYPTGAYVVVKPKVFNNEYKAGEIITMDREIFQKLFKNIRGVD